MRSGPCDRLSGEFRGGAVEADVEPDSAASWEAAVRKRLQVQSESPAKNNTIVPISAAAERKK